MYVNDLGWEIRINIKGSFTLVAVAVAAAATVAEG